MLSSVFNCSPMRFHSFTRVGPFTRALHTSHVYKLAFDLSYLRRDREALKVAPRPSPLEDYERLKQRMKAREKERQQQQEEMKMRTSGGGEGEGRLSPYMTEDVRLERVYIHSYDEKSFTILAPSALNLSSSSDKIDLLPTFIAVPSLPMTEEPANSKSKSNSNSKSKSKAKMINASTSANSPSYLSAFSINHLVNSNKRKDMALPSMIDLRSSIVVTQSLVMLWKPTQWSEVTLDSLVFLSLMHPKPEILLFGSGNCIEQVPAEVDDFCTEHGISIEVLKSSDAAGTFNMLSGEDRYVVAALLPSGFDPLKEERYMTWKEKEARRKAQSPSGQLRAKIEGHLKSS